jgi:hypothetical protein
MAETVGNAEARKADEWRERIREQERSGLPVKQFCKEGGVSEWSFYGETEGGVWMVRGRR